MDNTQPTLTSQHLRALYPYELAHAAGVSRRTMTKWMSAHRETLANLGYTSDSRILPPSAVKFLSDFYCINLNSSPH